MDNNDLSIYKNSEGNIIVDAIFKDETLWLTRKGMSKVFDCSTDNISFLSFSFISLIYKFIFLPLFYNIIFKHVKISTSKIRYFQ